MIDMLAVLEDTGTEHGTSAKGWIQFPCPVCEDTGKHAGWKSGRVVCWRCGRLDALAVAEALYRRSGVKRPRRLAEAGGDTTPPPYPGSPRLGHPAPRLALLPGDIGPMRPVHHALLRAKGLDSHKIEQDWNLHGIGPLAVPLLAGRLWIPAHDAQGTQILAWQARSVSSRAEARYVSNTDEQGTPIKTLLYGFHRARARDWVVVTEGPSKVWRLGFGAVGTFGAQFTREQVCQLRAFRRVYVLFDNDLAGRVKGDELGTLLAGAWPDKEVKVLRCSVPDPGDLPEKEAEALMHEIALGLV